MSVRPPSWMEQALFSDWPEPRLPFRFPAPDHGATALRYALLSPVGSLRRARKAIRTLREDYADRHFRRDPRDTRPVVDLLDVLARYARHAPRTPEAVAARVGLERHLKVQNWVAEGLIRRANMPLPHKWLMEPDGTWTQVY